MRIIRARVLEFFERGEREACWRIMKMWNCRAREGEEADEGIWYGCSAPDDLLTELHGPGKLAMCILPFRSTTL